MRSETESLLGMRLGLSDYQTLTAAHVRKISCMTDLAVDS